MIPLRAKIANKQTPALPKTFCASQSASPHVRNDVKLRPWETSTTMYHSSAIIKTSNYQRPFDRFNSVPVTSPIGSTSDETSQSDRLWILTTPQSPPTSPRTRRLVQVNRKIPSAVISWNKSRTVCRDAKLHWPVRLDSIEVGAQDGKQKQSSVMTKKYYNLYFSILSACADDGNRFSYISIRPTNVPALARSLKHSPWRRWSWPVSIQSISTYGKVLHPDATLPPRGSACLLHSVFFPGAPRPFLFFHSPGLLARRRHLPCHSSSLGQPPITNSRPFLGAPCSSPHPRAPAQRVSVPQHPKPKT